jgi:hypothetical protein
VKRASVFGGSILLVEIRSPPSPCKSPICTREPGLGLEGAPRYPRATRQPLGLLWSLCVKAFESRLSVECAKAGMPRQRRELMEVGIDTTQQQLPFLPFLRGGARLLCSRSITYGGKYSDACGNLINARLNRIDIQTDMYVVRVCLLQALFGLGELDWISSRSPCTKM